MFYVFVTSTNESNLYHMLVTVYLTVRSVNSQEVSIHISNKTFGTFLSCAEV